MSEAAPPAAGSLERMVAVLVTGSVPAAAPPGVEPAAFGRALVSDTADLVAGLEIVTPAVAVTPAGEAALGGHPVEELVWPGTRVLRLPGAGDCARPEGVSDGAPGSGAAEGAAGLAAGAAEGAQGLAARTLGELAGIGAGQAAVLAADAPDLPPLLIGKLLRALGSQPRGQIALCPAEGGGLVALAAWLPAPGWLAGVHTGPGSELDVDDIAERLDGAAPRRGAVRTGPGWRRIRSAADVARLDPGLEGWDATRDLLFARHPRR